MKKNLSAIIAFILAGAAMCPAAHAEDSIKEGKWSITVVSKTTGLPKDIPAQTMTTTACITNANPMATPKMPPGCEAPKVQRNGNTVNYQSTCNKPTLQMTTNGQMTYTGDTMHGEAKSDITTGNSMHMQSTTTFSGKYVGPCQ